MAIVWWCGIEVSQKNQIIDSFFSLGLSYTPEKRIPWGIQFVFTITKT